MKFIYFLFTSLLLLVLSIMLISSSGGRAAAAGAGNTGAPGEPTTCGTCHNSGIYGVPIVQLAASDLMGGFITQYTPGQSYAVGFNVVSPLAAGFGFQATALDASDNKAGSFSSPIANTQIATVGAREYAEQVGTSTTAVFGWIWTAPATGTGDVTFYGVGNAVDGTGSTANDNGSPAPITLTLTEAVVMPMSLTEFNADVEKHNISLNWTTEMEENTDYFEIERSIDGRYFDVIGKIKAAGNSTENVEYSFDDEKPNSINYYRLRSVDFDESSTYSNVINANIGETISGINMFPLPVASTATIELEVAKSGNYTMNIFNISGQLVRSESITVNENEQISFDANDLNTGLYVIEFQGNDRKFVREFIKQ